MFCLHILVTAVGIVAVSGFVSWARSALDRDRPNESRLDSIQRVEREAEAATARLRVAYERAVRQIRHIRRD